MKGGQEVVRGNYWGSIPILLEAGTSIEQGACHAGGDFFGLY